MIVAPQSLDEAISQYDRESAREKVERAEKQRAEMLRRFPLDHWTEMSLEEYALGQEGFEDNFCRWMEFLTPDLGSIKGGSSRKLIIYKRRNKPGWYFPKKFDNERDAWDHLRADFERAFELARNGSGQRLMT